MELDKRSGLLKSVIDAEMYLAEAQAWLVELEVRVKGCNDREEKRKLKNALEQDQIRFSQMMADVVIFKAAHGIFTEPQTYPKQIK